VLHGVVSSRGHRPDAAFTLIEVLVVIAVIALLVGILLPVLAGTRTQARTMQGLANLSQIGRAAQQYAHDWREMLPVGYHKTGDAKDTDWTCLLNNVMVGTGPTYATMDLAHFSKVFRDPNAAIAAGRVHYSAHPALMPDLTPPTTMGTYRLGQAKRLTELMLAMDGPQDPDNQNNAHATAWRLDNGDVWLPTKLPAYYDAGATDNDKPVDPGPNLDTAAGAGTIRWRQHHNAAANLLFLDGHARTTPPAGVRKANIRPDR
jgi:prepilin-type N-terminal cleavage/methylation domain-containing protein/prepilin-type processing-associated H-X9-DG protein